MAVYINNILLGVIISLIICDFFDLIEKRKGK